MYKMRREMEVRYLLTDPSGKEESLTEAEATKRLESARAELSAVESQIADLQAKAEGVRSFVVATESALTGRRPASVGLANKRDVYRWSGKTRENAESIIGLLKERPMRTQDIAEKIGLSASLTSFILGALHDARVLDLIVEGRIRRYRLRPAVSSVIKTDDVPSVGFDSDEFSRILAVIKQSASDEQRIRMDG